MFVEQGGELSPEKFANLLAEQMGVVFKTILPKHDKDNGKAMDILKKRNEYVFKGKVFSSQGPEWTVIYSDEKGLADACFSRVVFVRPVKTLLEAVSENQTNIQTIGIAIDDIGKRTEFADRATLFRADRCPKVGEMSFFESPWDGMFALDRMVRWVTTYEN